MIKIDLITGFLGSGKTTFLKKYAEHLMKKGLRIGIVENDYGAVNVDMMLLTPLEGDNCVIETVAGACDYDCHKRRFKTKLIALGMSGVDRVIVEPSGIFDVDEFFDNLREEPLDRWYEIGSVITVIEAADTGGLSDYARYIAAAQILSAGAVILSKTQLCSERQINERIEKLNSLLTQAGCEALAGDSFFTSAWDDLTADDLNRIADSGYNVREIKRHDPSESCFQTLYFMRLPIKGSEIKKKIRSVFDDDCGNVFRIKGFFNDNGWFELNATADQTEISPTKIGQDVIIVIGENLNENRIRNILSDG